MGYYEICFQSNMFDLGPRSAQQSLQVHHSASGPRVAPLRNWAMSLLASIASGWLCQSLGAKQIDCFGVIIDSVY